MKDSMQATIFYADDDADDLFFFKEVVSEINESVTLFERGDEMLEVLHNPPPKASVIFLDLNMPVKSGIEILSEIKATPAISNIPIVILTTSANPSDITLCKKLGARLYIKKPTSLNSLRKAVNYVLHIDWNTYIPTDNDFFYRQQ